jgi:tetratricopeptide (TPR) repeat protein
MNRIASSRWLPGALVVLATVAVFGWSVSFPLLDWDDHLNISENRLINPPSMGGLLVLWTRPYAGLYVPATYTLWSVEAALAARPANQTEPHPLDPRVFHLGNVLLHAANAWLVWLLLARLVGSRWSAAAGALLFALHPLQVESACWVTETKGLLCGLCGFSAVLLFDRFVEMRGTRRSAPEPAQPGNSSLIALYVVAAVLFVLALLAKPAAVTLPLAAWVIATWAGRDDLSGRRGWSIAMLLLPWLAVAVGVAMLTRDVQGAEVFVEPTTWWQRPVVAADALAFYLYKLVVPLDLAPDYGRSPAWLLASNWVWVTWLLPAGLAIVLGLLPKYRVWRQAGLLSLALLLPVLGLVPFAFQRFSTVADRYAYLAMLGPAIALAALGAMARRRTTLAIVVALVLCTLVSAAQSRHWRSNAALFAQAAAINPRSSVALNGLGNVHSQQGNWNAALAYYRRAVESDPDNASSYLNVGRAELALNRPLPAIVSFERALQLRPDYPKVREPYAQALAVVGRIELAAAQLQLLLEQQPDNALVWENLGRVRAFQGRTAEAIQHLERALRIDPQLKSARQELARLQQNASSGKLPAP